MSRSSEEQLFTASIVKMTSALCDRCSRRVLVGRLKPDSVEKTRRETGGSSRRENWKSDIWKRREIESIRDTIRLHNETGMSILDGKYKLCRSKIVIFFVIILIFNDFFGRIMWKKPHTCGILNMHFCAARDDISCQSGNSVVI